MSRRRIGQPGNMSEGSSLSTSGSAREGFQKGPPRHYNDNSLTSGRSSEGGPNRFMEISTRLQALEEEKAMLEMAMRRLHTAPDISPNTPQTEVVSYDNSSTARNSFVSDNAYAAGRRPSNRRSRSSRSDARSITGMNLAMGGEDFSSFGDSCVNSAWEGAADIGPYDGSSLAMESARSDRAYASGMPGEPMHYHDRPLGPKAASDSITGMRLRVNPDDYQSAYGDSCMDSAWAGHEPYDQQPYDHSHSYAGGESLMSDNAYVSGMHDPRDPHMYPSRGNQRRSHSSQHSITGMKLALGDNAPDVVSAYGDSIMNSAWRDSGRSGAAYHEDDTLLSEHAYAGGENAMDFRGYGGHRRGNSIAGMDLVINPMDQDMDSNFGDSAVGSAWGGVSSRYGSNSAAEWDDQSAYDYSESAAGPRRGPSGGVIKFPKGMHPDNIFHDNESEFGETDVVEGNRSQADMLSITSREDDSNLYGARHFPCEIACGDRSVCSNLSDLGSISLFGGQGGAPKKRRPPKLKNLEGNNRRRQDLPVGNMLYGKLNASDEFNYNDNDEFAYDDGAVESQAVASQRDYYDAYDTASVMGVPKEIGFGERSDSSVTSDLESISVVPAPRAIRRHKSENISRMSKRQNLLYNKNSDSEEELSARIAKKEQDLVDYAIELSLKESQSSNMDVKNTVGENAEDQEKRLIELAMERSLKDHGKDSSLPNDVSLLEYQKNANDHTKPSAVKEIQMPATGKHNGQLKETSSNRSSRQSSASSITYTDINTDAPALPVGGLRSPTNRKKQRQRSRSAYAKNGAESKNPYVSMKAEQDQEEEMLKLAIERSLNDTLSSAGSSITSAESAAHPTYMFENATAVSEFDGSFEDGIQGDADAFLAPKMVALNLGGMNSPKRLSRK